MLPELRSATADLCWKYVSKVLPVRGIYLLVPRIEKHAEDELVITHTSEPAANEQSTKKGNGAHELSGH